AEPRAIGDDDLRRVDVAVHGGAVPELDAVVGGDVAGELSLDHHVLRMNLRFDARLRSYAKVAGEVDLAANGSLDQHRLVAGDLAVDRDIRAEKRAGRTGRRAIAGGRANGRLFLICEERHDGREA